MLTKLGVKLCVNESAGKLCVCDDSDNSAIVATPKLHRVKGNTYTNLDGTTEVATEDVNPDIILINLGMNDYLSANTLEELTYKCVYKTPETSTFYNWYNYVLVNITGISYLHAQVYCLDMNFTRYNNLFLLLVASTGATLQEYSHAICDVARIYGVKCLHTSRICVHSDTYMTSDKIHPKTTMMKMIANQCYTEMLADNCL